MGSTNGVSYSIPEEAHKVFENGTLNNKLIPTLPSEIKDAAKHVHFKGNDLPSIPINRRFAESVSALKAFEASMLNVLRSRKYGTGFDDVTIDTDHASLFFMTPFLMKVVNDSGEPVTLDVWNPEQSAGYGFRNTDLHRATADLHRVLATNIYETKDGRFYHAHGKVHRLT